MHTSTIPCLDPRPGKEKLREVCGSLLPGSIGRLPTLPHSRLLHFVQFLINQHRQEREQKHSRADAEYPHRKSQLVDLR